MKKKFDELRENLEEFTRQTDYSILLLGCTPEEAPYVAQLLAGVDQAESDDYFLTFVEPFEAPGSYLDALVQHVARELEAANPVRHTRGEAPFKPLPGELGDARRAPGERLELLLCFLGSLLDQPRENAFVVSFLPFENRDNDAYCRLMSSLLPVPEVLPWLAPLRVVISDDRRERQLVSQVGARNTQEVLSYEVDFSTPALTDALARDAANPAVPMRERMACLLQLAALDFSHRRYADAIEKYGVLHDYYREQPLPAMQVLCLQGLGDTLHAARRPEAAKQALQSGLALALEHQALIPLLHTLLSIVGVCVTLSQHAEAESYAESGVQAARATLNAPLYTTFLEKKGDARLAQGNAALAVETYRHCLALCETYEQFSVWQTVLGKLAELYRAARLRAEADQAERELDRVRRLEEQRRAGAGPAPASASASAVEVAA
jgi:tetratricopeptide (TPR) repeat protein